VFLKCNYVFHFCPIEEIIKFNYIVTAASGKILNMCKYNRGSVSFKEQSMHYILGTMVCPYSTVSQYY